MPSPAPRGEPASAPSPLARRLLHSWARGPVLPLKNQRLRAESASRVPLSGPPRFCCPLLGVPVVARGHAGDQNELPASGQLTSRLSSTCNRHSVPCQVACPQGPGVTARTSFYLPQTPSDETERFGGEKEEIIETAFYLLIFVVPRPERRESTVDAGLVNVFGVHSHPLTIYQKTPPVLC